MTARFLLLPGFGLLTEKARAPLAAAVRAAVKPEEHELSITAAE